MVSRVLDSPGVLAPSAALPGWRGLAVRLLPWAPLTAILAGALFLRLYRLDGFVTYYPDTYAQLDAVDNLLSGRFPVSYLYPPGIALFLAPVSLVMPNTLLTLQVTVVASGVALIAVGYAAVVAATGDRRAALCFAAALAICATFVFYTRLALFDVINTLLIAVTLFLAPAVARRGPATQAAFGVLVFAALTVRLTNLVVLPLPLLIASLPQVSWPPSPAEFLRHLRSRAVLTTGLVVAALYAAYLAFAFDSLTRFVDPKAGSVVDWSSFPSRLGRYVQTSLLGYGDQFRPGDALFAAAVLALAIVGARRLWAVDRRLLVSIVALVALWLPVHASYEVFQDRYAMPAFFFILMLASLGLSGSLDWFTKLQFPWQRVGLATLLTLAVVPFVGRQVEINTSLLLLWPDELARSHEVVYDQLRAVLRDADGPHSTLVSSQALALDEANEDMATLDLIEHSETYGSNADAIDRLVSYVRDQHAAGKAVYYHYTEFEDVRSRFRKYELTFYDYYAALQREFSLVELLRTEERPERLYLVMPGSVIAGPPE